MSKTDRYIYKKKKKKEKFENITRIETFIYLNIFYCYKKRSGNARINREKGLI